MKLTNHVDMWVNTIDCAENFSLKKIKFLPNIVSHLANHFFGVHLVQAAWTNCLQLLN
jgi:hypothetical protein